MSELFEWMEFIVHNNPIASAGIKKMSEVPVTSFRYASIGDDKESTFLSKDSWKTILEDSLRLKSSLLSISYNTLLYGNCFVSVYSPIERRGTCNKCKSSYNLRKLQNVKVSAKRKDSLRYREGRDVFSTKNKEKTSRDDTDKFKPKEKKKPSGLSFSAKCPKCSAIREMEIEDIYLKDHRGMNIILWNPNSIRLSSNQISGETDFFYTVESDLLDKIQKNELSVISSIPLPMIEAALTKKIFKFAKGHIYHIKRDMISGISTSWGMPSLAAAIPAFMSLMILRKANEKIAQDYMVPLRVMYPSQSGAGSDMYNFMGGGSFVDNVKNMLNIWKIDPSAVQVSPAPLGVETILGDGKMLVLYQEIEQLESNIANSLGIPIEFIKGGLSYTSQGSSLRLLQNQLDNVSEHLNGVIDFIVDRVSNTTGKDRIKVDMIPFKVIDDIQEKSAILNLALNGQNSVSRNTILEMFNLDAGQEKEKIEQDKKDDIKSQIDVQRYNQETLSSIEEQAKNDANMNNSSFSALNQQGLMQEAQTYVDQLSQMDTGQRKSELDEMSKTNYILYGVVKALLDMKENKKQYGQEGDATQ